MTTVVYRDDIIAVDSQANAGGLITDNNCDKIIKKDGIVYVVCGCLSDAEEMIKAYNGKEYRQNADVSAIIDDHGKVYVAAIDKEDGYWRHEITGRIYAIGSGSDHAWTAMDYGASAKGAVRMAMKRDIYTGGRIKTHRIK